MNDKFVFPSAYGNKMTKYSNAVNSISLLTINPICLEVKMNVNKLCFLNWLLKTTVYVYMFPLEKNEWKSLFICGQSQSQKMENEMAEI